MIAPRLCVVVLVATLLTPAAAGAQQVWVNAAVQREVQDFEDDVIPSRLDGSATGWTIGLSALALRHAVVAIEWSDGGTIADARTTTLEANGRTVMITSSLTHRTRALSVLGGFSHGVSGRVRVAYLGGIAFTRVRREFTSTAAGVLLVPPSDRTASAPPIDDRFATLAGGAEATVRISGHVHALIGARLQRIELTPDLTGWGLRTLFGGGWTF
jgi:hypothetical protein